MSQSTPTKHDGRAVLIAVVELLVTIAGALAVSCPDECVKWRWLRLFNYWCVRIWQLRGAVRTTRPYGGCAIIWRSSLLV